MTLNIAIAVVLLLIVAYIIMRSYIEESFANKNEKARAIVDWFHSVANPTYASFRDHTAGDSNIVEYEDARRLFAEKNLTVESMARIL